MVTPPLPLLDAPGLLALARAGDAKQPCPACGPVDKPGWEALPGTFDAGALQRVATLRDPAVDDPTLAEFHPAGTNGWSADAPIAPRHHPYNRCEAWTCKTCGRAFLRYTEYGGYYHEERIRRLDAALVVDAPL